MERTGVKIQTSTIITLHFIIANSGRENMLVSKMKLKMTRVVVFTCVPHFFLSSLLFFRLGRVALRLLFLIYFYLDQTRKYLCVAPSWQRVATHHFRARRNFIETRNHWRLPNERR